MINNYTNLSTGSKTWLEKQEPDVVGNAPNTKGKLRISWLLSLMLFVSLLFTSVGFSQTGTIQIGTGTATTTTLPISSCWGYSYTQQIVTAAEYSANGGVAGNITKIRYYYTGGDTNQAVWNNWTIYLGHTTKTSFSSTSDWVPFASLTQVFSGSIAPVANNWYEITFTTPFAYNGTNNLVVAVDENIPNFSCSATWRSYTSATNTGIYHRSDSVNADPAAPPAASGRVAALAQIQFFGAVASCLSPTGLTSSNVGSNSATISWAAASGTPLGYQYEVRSSGAAGSGATGLAASGSTGVGTLTANVSGLTPVTSYQYYVRTDCGAGTFSSWSNVGTFTTACLPVSVLPWNEGFEGVTVGSTVVGTSTNLPSCWNSQSTQWSSTDATTYNTPRAGTKYLRYAWSTTNAFMWTPGFQLTAGTAYDFSFYAAGDGWTTWVNDVFVNSSQSATGATQLTPSYSPTGPGSTVIQPYTKVTRRFVPSVNGVYYFAIRGNQSSSSPWYMAFDDFSLVAVPLCGGTPNNGTIAISQTSGCSGGSLSFTSSGLSIGDGITYQWQSSTTNSDPWNNVGTGETYSTTSTAGTTYYRLATICSNSATTSYSNVVSFAGIACGSNNIPASGNSTVECGTSTYLYDNGGPSGNYSAGSNGYTVLDNSGTGVISISGSYGYVETSWDFIRIYSGAGTGGTLLYTYSNTGGGVITPFSSAPGQPITIQFTSDGSGEGSGFAIQAVYSGACLTCESPVGGTATAATAAYCNSGSTTISATGYTQGSGSRYQWESSTDNFATAGVAIGSVSSSYANLSTGTITTTTYYRLRVFCNANPGGAVYSNVVPVTINFPGTVSAAGAATICSGQSTPLTAAAVTGTMVSYAWTPAGSLTPATGANVSAAPSTTTTYTVIGQDNNGCFTPGATVTVTVNPSPSAVTVTPSVDAGVMTNNTICAGNTVKLTASGGTVSGVNTILAENFDTNAPSWVVTNGASSPAASNWAYQSVPYTYSTSYTGFSTVNGGKFAITNADAGGSGSTTNTVLTSPSFSTVGYTTADLSFEQVYRVWTSGDATVKIEISTDGGANWATLTDYIGSAQGTTTSTAPTTVSLASYLNQSNLKIRFNYVSTWGFEWILDDIRISGNHPVSVSQNWTAVPPTQLYTDAAATVPYVANTTATTVYAKPTASTTFYSDFLNGICSTQGSATVNVNALPTFTVAPITICSGSTGTLTAISGGSNSYSWTPVGGGATLFGASVNVSPTATTTYNVTATSNDTTPSCSNTIQGTVTVKDPGTIVSGTTVRTVSPGQLTTFEVVTSGGPLTYQWQVDDTVNGWQNILAANPDYTGENTAVLHVSNITLAFDTYQYRCLVTGDAPCATLDPIEAVLNVTNTGFSTQPADASLCGQTEASFTVVTTGDAPYNVQWQVSTDNGANFTDIVDGFDPVTGLTFAGANDFSPKTLSVSGITTAHDDYQFKCQLDFFLDSSIATLSVNTPVTVTSNFVSNPTAILRCGTPIAPATNLSITTTGSVAGVVWKYATSPAGPWNTIVAGTPLGATYSGVTSNNLLVTTAANTPAGDYYYKAFVTGAGSGPNKCADQESAVAKISVSNPTITVTASAPVYCSPGAAVVLTAGGSNINSYSWSTSQTGTSINVSPSVSTTYTVTGTDSNGCTKTASTTVNVGNSFTLAATSSATSLCQGSSLNLVATPTALSGGGTANISFGTNLQSSGTGTTTYPVTLSGIPAGSVITSAQLQLTNVNAINGSYRSEIRVALSGAHTLSATQISTLTSGGAISPNPVINLSGFTATSGTINLLLTETYDDSGTDATFGEVKLVIVYTQPATYTYAWSSTPAGFTASGASTSATPAVSTSYSVLATSNSGCTASATTSLVAVTPTPVVTATNNGQPSATRCGFGKVTLTATASASNVLNWYTNATGGSPIFTGTSFQTPDLNASTSYYVEAATPVPASPVLTYCASTSTSTSYYINSFSTTGGNRNISNLNTGQSPSGYGNYTALVAGKSAGSTVNFSVTPASGTYGIGLWIDWNNDGDFVDAGEQIYNSAAYVASASGTITVPVSASPGNYRMRVIADFLNTTPPPCGTTSTSSETEDYTFEVSGCSSPSRTQVTAVVTPAPALALSSAVSTICAGQSTPTVNITAATVGNYNSYVWSPAGSVTGSAAAGFVFTPASSTVYTLTATNAAGCVALDTHSVTVNPNPGTPVLASNSPICQGSALNLTSTVVSNSVANLLSSNFDSGNTFPLNGWTVLNGTTNNWFVGNAAGTQSGANAAYVGTNNVATASASVNFFYRDVVIPAGYTNISLQFYLKMAIIDNTFDFIKVYTTTTSNTPVVGTLPSTGYSEVFSYTTPVLANFTLQTVSLPNSLAGTTVRLVFAYKSDSVSPYSAPAIDSINLTGSPAPAYAWTGPNSFTSSVQNPSIAGATPAASGTYNLEVTNSFGCKSNASVSATVHPTPTAVAPANQLYYNGLATAAIPLSGTPSGVTFDISGGAAVGLANATGITTIPSFIPATGSATVTITPKANGCTGASVSYNIVVSAVNANPIANQIYCEGATTAAIPLSHTPVSLTGVTYAIIGGASVGLADVSGVTAIPSFVPVPGSATITVIPQYGGVSGGAVSGTITVNPLPTATIAGSTAVCRNDVAPTVTFTGANGTAPYTFTYKFNGSTNQTIVSSGNTATIAQPTGTAGTFTYTLVSVQDSSSTTCSNAQGGIVTIVVHPTPTVAAVPNQAYYSGFATAAIPLTGTPSGVTFNISGGAASGLADVNGVTAIPSFIPTATPSTVTVTPVANGCIGIPVTYQISFNPVIVNIASNVCGSINNGLNNQINCTQASVPGYTVTGYQFEITNTDTGVVSIVQSSQHHFKLTDADNYAYGTLFTIRVAAILNGNVQGYFGNTCSLTTASVATTKVVTAQCGATLVFVNSTINANAVSQTNLYRFRVSLASAPTTYYYIERTVPNFKLTDVVGLPILYNTEYRVDVQIRVKLAGFEAWSQYGQRCSVFTPEAPVTSLVASQCEDYLVPSNTSPINAIAFPGVTAYRFRLTGYDEFGDVNYMQTVDSPTASFTLSMFSGLTPGTTYTVGVAMELFGTFTDFGKDCTIVTPSVARLAVVEFKATAYPNPYAANFMIKVASNSTSSISIKVYDMVGRLVEQRVANASELENTPMGDRYPSGVYNVVVTQDETVQTVRVVKR